MAKEQSITIVAKARDEASAKLRQMNQNIKKGVMSAVGPFIAIGAAISMASKAAAAGVMMHMATAKRAAAMQANDVKGVLESQIKINQAWSELGGSVPVVGEAVKKAMDAWADTEGIKAAIAGIKEIEDATRRYHDANRQMMRGTEILRAQLAGATAAEISAIQNTHRKKDHTRTLKDMDEALAKARKSAQEQSDAMVKATKRVATAKEIVAHTPWTDPLAIGASAIALDLAKKNLAAAEMAYRETNENVEELFKERMAAVDAMADEGGAREAKQQRDAVEETRKAEEGKRAERKKTADEAKRLADKQAADAKRLADEEMRAAKIVADDRRRLEDIVFNATRSRREQDVRDLERQMAEMRQTYAHNASMMTAIEEAEQVRRAQIAQEALDRAKAREGAGVGGPSGAGSFEVRATQSRFLSRAQDRAKPVWVRDVTDATSKQTAELENALGKLPTELALAFTQQIQAGSL